MNRDPIVGIDLGTTFSLVAYVDERGAQIIRDADGDGRVPSVISITRDDKDVPVIRVGWNARNHAIENPRATVYSVKRLIGKSFAEIQRELPFLAYGVSGGPRETVQIEINGRRYHPEEISSLILRELKTRAELHLGCEVRKAVITVPAYFDDAQRQATRDAGRAAGLEVVRIINEPTAAALAYGIGLRGQEQRRSDQATERRRSRSAPISLPQPRCHEEAAEPILSSASSIQNQETLAVFDLGGGTFDISILRIEDGVFQVLATAGDTHLGGDDFDRRIIERVQADVQSQYSVSIDAPAARQALRTLAEAVKVRLSEQNTATLELELGKSADGRPRAYTRTFTRDEFERMTADLVDRTVTLLHQALRDAKLDRTDLAHIVLVGGSTRMPLVRKRVEEAFGRPPYTALNPDEVVALGAAVQSALLAANQTAAGSAARAALPDMLLLDVTPLSLGIETLGGAMSKLILRNTTIPCRVVEQFSTFVDGQTAIKLNILQGERELARDCRSLGEFELRGIPPMPAGIPKVEVEFLIDANGILNVSAREQRSGQAASIQIAPNRGLTREEAERIAREGIEHGASDIAEHRRIDLLNQIEFDTRKTEQMLSRVGSLLSPQERAKIESDIAKLRERGKIDNDLDALYQALTDFGHSTVRLAELGIREVLKS